MKLAGSLKMAALVEVHTEVETRRAVDAGARIIGVNNRDLKTLAVDIETSVRLRALIPPGYIAVSESGIKTSTDLIKLRRAAYDAFLIGERFMTQPDPGKALSELLKMVSQVAGPQL
jgi:indole-3-glycerol phosphate synthase